MLGHPLKFSPAPEPTNIIWENMHMTKKVKGFRTLVSLGVVVLALLVAFAIFFILKTQLAPDQYVKPDCESQMTNIYNNDFNSLEVAAKSEYMNYEFGRITKFSGALECYCEALDADESINIRDYSVSVAGFDNPVRICNQWKLD